MTLNERLYIMEKKQENKLKEIELIEIKKEQKKEEKQYTNDLKIACNNELADFFDRIFSKSRCKTELELQTVLLVFYSIDNRNKIIADIGKTTQEQDHLNSIYDKTLNTVYKKWKNNIKYLEMQKIIEENKEKENEEQTTMSIVLIILVILAVSIFILVKWFFIGCIVLSIFIFLVLLASTKK